MNQVVKTRDDNMTGQQAVHLYVPIPNTGSDTQFSLLPPSQKLHMRLPFRVLYG